MKAAENAIRYDEYYPMEFPRFGIAADGDIAIARKGCELFVSQRKERIEKLGIFCRSNFVDFGNSVEELSEMNQFIYDNLSANMDLPHQIAGVWVECALDLSAFLGTEIMDRCSNLEWAVFEDHHEDEHDFAELGLRNIGNHEKCFPIFSTLLLAFKQAFYSKKLEPNMRTSLFSGIIENWSKKLAD